MMKVSSSGPADWPPAPVLVSEWGDGAPTPIAVGCSRRSGLDTTTPPFRTHLRPWHWPPNPPMAERQEILSVAPWACLPPEAPRHCAGALLSLLTPTPSARSARRPLACLASGSRCPQAPVATPQWAGAGKRHPPRCPPRGRSRTHSWPPKRSIALL